MWLVALVACAPPEARDGPRKVVSTRTDTGTVAPVPDPDVHTFVPDWAPPAGVSTVLFVGDSMTVGTGVDDSERWATLIQPELKARFGDDLRFIDLSRPGETANLLYELLLPRTAGQHEGPLQGGILVMGTVGLADLIRDVRREDPKARLMDDLVAIDAWLDDPARFPDGAWMFLANIYDTTDGTNIDCSGERDITDALAIVHDANAAHLELAQAHDWAWVDAHGHFLGHGERFDDPTYEHHDPDDPTKWYVDCLHPDPRGHEEMFRLFLSAVDGEPLTLDP
jgi:lysophospholipase L1-like esterase